MFRREPAITRLDWLITPSRRSSQGFATPTCAAQGWVAEAFPLLGRLASGLTHPTLGESPAPPHVKLAGGVNLLAHYAKGTLSPRLQLLEPAQGFRPRGQAAGAHVPSRYCALPVPRLEPWGLATPTFGQDWPTGVGCWGSPGLSEAALGEEESCLPAAGSP